jgi:ATP-binding protein involved in chromosome partitioning
MSLAGVRHVVVVSSGKGGVGKSTITTNLAVCLARSGKAVGILDADVYGPDIPIMFGVSKPPTIANNRIQPPEEHGVKLMSLGFLVDPEQAVIWRGPMVMQALDQMMNQVDWGDLDILLVDMPPGTGDAQLTMTQKVPLSGAILVSTPQAVALADTIKGLAMFRKVETPILGMVENMSEFLCPHCGQASEFFRRGTVVEACARYEVPYLGDVPFDPACREGADRGVPITVSQPGSPVGQAFRAIADRILEAMPERTAPIPIVRRAE